MARTAGRHFLQIPGPSPVPDRILRAIDMPVIDHRGPDFAVLGKKVLSGIKEIFKCAGLVIIYPASGTGAWEAALINCLSPGDRVLMYESGHFASLWNGMAEKLGLVPEFIEGDWRRAAAIRLLSEQAPQWLGRDWSQLREWETSAYSVSIPSTHFEYRAWRHRFVVHAVDEFHG